MTARTLFALALILTGLSLGCSSSKKKDMTSDKTKMEESKTKMDDQSKKPMETAKASLNETLCKMTGDERKISIVEDGKGCKVVYTKHGETSDIASSKWGKGHCEKVVEKIVTNLKAASFDCM